MKVLKRGKLFSVEGVLYVLVGKVRSFPKSRVLAEYHAWWYAVQLSDSKNGDSEYGTYRYFRHQELESDMCADA